MRKGEKWRLVTNTQRNQHGSRGLMEQGRVVPSPQSEGLTVFYKGGLLSKKSVESQTIRNVLVDEVHVHRLGVAGQ